MILLAGFGPFGETLVNPAQAIVQAVDGARVRGHTLVGHVMPVSHRTAHLDTLALARAHRPALVLGFGIAVSREQVTVERRARRRVADRLDAWGEVRALPQGPRSLPVSIDPARLATALAAGLSDDAGDYVCNGWLYRMLRGDPSGTCGFVHVPPTGLEPDRLLRGLERYLEDG